MPKYCKCQNIKSLIPVHTTKLKFDENDWLKYMPEILFLPLKRKQYFY